MDEVLESAREAMKATHSQDIQTVSEIIQKTAKYANALNQQVDQYYQNMKQRKRWLLSVLLFFSLTFFLIAYQRSRLK